MKKGDIFSTFENNLEIAESNVIIFSKLFDRHSSGENVSMKERE